MLKLKDVYQILESVPESGDAILIGGQALNLWAEYYAAKNPALNEYAPFFSQDIDFLGGEDTADDLHKYWKGKIIKPSKDSYTPTTAMVEFNLNDGRRVKVDFLEVMLGVDNDLIRNEARMTDFPDAHKSLKVLHPIHCLASRIYNTYGELDRRSRQYASYEIKRINLTIVVMEHYFSDLFRAQDNASHEEAYRLIDYLANLAIQPPAKRAYYQDNVDPLKAIPTNTELGMSETFLNDHFPRIKSYITRERDQYARQTEKSDLKPGE